MSTLLHETAVDFFAPNSRANATMIPQRHSGHWVEALSHLDPRYGGLTAVVPQLGQELALDHKFTIDIASFSAVDESPALAGYSELSVSRWPAARGTWIRNAALRERLRKLVNTADGIHVHGLWESHTAVVTYVARSLRKPYILSAHGMLEPWALANKGLKKRVYSALIERQNIEGAACLHALTRAEADDYRRTGSRRPIAIIPNGVLLPPTVNRSLFLESYPALRGKRILLFLGRLHFKKGLDILVQAWAQLTDRFPDAVLVLAGPDDENSRAVIEKTVQHYGLHDRVLFTGMLDAPMKWSALSTSHCFVLPSYSEGLSVAVLEAMGMGLPVIVSDRCHLPEIPEAGAGWQVAAELSPLKIALEQMLENTPKKNAEIGHRGRQLVQNRFSWPVVAQQMAELYHWVQGGPRPTSFPLLEVTA